MSDQVSPLRLIDVRRTALALFRDWAFTGAALTSLALGVGALTAIVSIVNALWFRPLPGSATERTFLVVVPVGAQTEEGELLDSISYRRVAPLARLPMLEHAAFEYQPGDNLVEAAMRPRIRLQERLDELRVAAVNASYFADLGVSVVGPGFVAADD